MLDIQIRQFRDELLEKVNGTELPLEVKRLVLNEILHAVSEASDTFINSQKQSIISQLAEAQNQEQPEKEE